jgi:hypothetical protein
MDTTLAPAAMSDSTVAQRSTPRYGKVARQP